MLQLTKYQLYCMMVLFGIGSTTLFAMGSQAKQDAWLAIIIGTCGGLVLVLIYTELLKHFPGKSIIGIMNELLGKKIGAIFGFMYFCYFAYASCGNLRDFGELITMTFLAETPMLIVMVALILSVIHILFLGVKVMGRTSELCMPFVVFSLIVIYVMIAITGKIDLQEMLPVLSDGIKPVLKEVYPPIINFPYGEHIIFTMLWCNVSPQQKVRKTAFLAIITSGVLITTSSVVITTVLGVQYSQTSMIPLLEVIKLINIGEFLSNLDGLGVIIIFIGGFYKIIIHICGSILAFKEVFHAKDYRYFIIPVGLFVLFYSAVFVPNYPYHIWLGFYPNLTHIINTFGIMLPALLLIILWIRNLSKKYIIKG